MTALDAPVPYGALFGTSLAGIFVATFIYGITVLQTILYFRKFPRDHVRWKVLVALVFALDTAALAVLVAAVLESIVSPTQRAQLSIVDGQFISVEYILVAILVFFVHCFYIDAIRILRAPVWVLFSLSLLALVSFVVGIVPPILQLHAPTITSLSVVPQHNAEVYTSRAAALALDGGVFILFCLLLPAQPSGFARWGQTIGRAFPVVFPRGALLAAMQAGELIVLAVQPMGLASLCVHFVLSRLYCVSFLATLMAREHARARGASRGTSGTDDADDYPTDDAPSTRAPAFTSVFDRPQFTIASEEEFDPDVQVERMARASMAAEDARRTRSLSPPKRGSGVFGLGSV